VTVHTRTTRHYAVRRVNPFEGVLQVVETSGARAYSPNGRTWQIQVLAKRPDHSWRSFSDVPPIEQFFNFGLWDSQDGLHRIPANPVMDIGAMTEAADRLAEVLHALLQELPFALIDHYECWSTDYEGNPVALLATAEDRSIIANLRPGRWQAARLADHGFVSASLAARGVPARGDLGPRQHAEQLERQVRQFGQHKTWFQRLADGSGDRIDPPGDGRPPSVGELPPLGLKTDWEDEQAQALVEDYLAWRSPQLLMLQNIDDALRSWLEPLACRQAIELAAGYRLIPRILDRDRIGAARVEAELRRAAR
jgi:hypothetical protein